MSLMGNGVSVKVDMAVERTPEEEAIARTAYDGAEAEPDEEWLNEEVAMNRLDSVPGVTYQTVVDDESDEAKRAFDPVRRSVKLGVVSFTVIAPRHVYGGFKQDCRSFADVQKFIEEQPSEMWPHLRVIVHTPWGPFEWGQKVFYRAGGTGIDEQGTVVHEGVFARDDWLAMLKQAGKCPLTRWTDVEDIRTDLDVYLPVESIFAARREKIDASR